MSPEKTVAQELFDDNVETPPENLILGGEQGDKPTIEGDSGTTKQQEFEDELFSKEDSAETTPTTEEQQSEPEEKQKKSKTDAAFWQKQYQEFDAMVKKANPILRDDLNRQLRAQRKGQTEGLPDSFEKATEAVRAEKVDIYENPQGFLDAMQKQLDRHESNMSNNYQRMQDQTYEQASWEQEAKSAEQAVNQLKSNYRAELKLDENTWKGIEDGAWQDVMDVLGLTENNKNDFLSSLGGPSRTAKVFQKSLENRLLKNSYLRKVAEGQADISGKIKAAAEVAQPTPQSAPAPKTISKKEKLIRAIEGAKGDQSAKDEIFGG